MRRVVGLTALSVVVVGALVAGIVLLAVTLTSTRSDVSRLKKEVASLEQSGVTMNNRLTTLESESPINDVARIKNAISKLGQCVPELQTEINSLSITGSYYGSSTQPAYGFNGQVAGWPLSISDSQQLSPECQSVLNGVSGP